MFLILFLSHSLDEKLPAFVSVFVNRLGGAFFYGQAECQSA